MRQRGKQSAASLEVTGIADTGPNLRPPHHLTATEAKLFVEVVANAPSGQFSASDVYLLTSFVRVTLVCDQAVKASAKANDKNSSDADEDAGSVCEDAGPAGYQVTSCNNVPYWSAYRWPCT